MDHEASKRIAAARAIEEIEDGMVVGLGSGSTAEIAVELLAARRLKIVAVPTSERTAQLARHHGLALATLDEHPQLALLIEGADQVERGTLNLVKGLGGALLREKIVASAARRMIVMVDDSKLVDRWAAIRRCRSRSSPMAGARRPAGWSGQDCVRPFGAAPSGRS